MVGLEGLVLFILCALKPDQKYPGEKCKLLGAVKILFDMAEREYQTT